MALVGIPWRLSTIVFRRAISLEARIIALPRDNIVYRVAVCARTHPTSWSAAVQAARVELDLPSYEEWSEGKGLGVSPSKATPKHRVKQYM